MRNWRSHEHDSIPTAELIDREEAFKDAVDIDERD